MSGLLYCFQSYLKRQSIRYALLIGLASGLLVLIRPTNIIMLLFPAILLIHYRHQLNCPPLLRDVVVAALVAFLTYLPVIVLAPHDWPVAAYIPMSEQRFYFNDPKIWQGLFSYRKGWFTYSPVLLMSLPGFWLLYQQKKQIYALAALLTLAVALYVHFSWWCWWYGGGFGARTLIEFLPLWG
ncbi:MAG: hypothetical protein U5L96_15745 [Owenweeksia sp.]|nr:hypothetical protein [Owenweeksia sp.]